ncbi:hypothetical protein AKJ08_2740 [Vulgatibacter incomptus]|uniref:Uncharacterized protein n=1 Tax=Vulgatibacter incomptus TaxID=1391653 RepID=A0A0K1PFP2_9BACT|nr:hypothetical protein AKJ08_2740 [Vulgatibacter incomptus]
MPFSKRTLPPILLEEELNATGTLRSMVSHFFAALRTGELARGAPFSFIATTRRSTDGFSGRGS